MHRVPQHPHPGGHMGGRGTQGPPSTHDLGGMGGQGPPAPPSWGATGFGESGRGGSCLCFGVPQFWGISRHSVMQFYTPGWVLGLYGGGGWFRGPLLIEEGGSRGPVLGCWCWGSPRFGASLDAVEAAGVGFEGGRAAQHLVQRYQQERQRDLRGPDSAPRLDPQTQAGPPDTWRDPQTHGETPNSTPSPIVDPLGPTAGPPDPWWDPQTHGGTLRWRWDPQMEMGPPEGPPDLQWKSRAMEGPTAAPPVPWWDPQTHGGTLRPTVGPTDLLWVPRPMERPTASPQPHGGTLRPR